jgi:non-heme chloroperoxidase
MIEPIRVGELLMLCSRPIRAEHRAVLFVHGYFADATIWSEWLPFFADRGFPAFAIHLRGRAASGRETKLGSVSLDDFTDDAREAVRFIASEHGMPAAVGHSMGGLIVQRLAAEQAIAAAGLIAPAPPRGISVLTPRVAIKQLKYMPAVLTSRTVTPDASDLRELVLNRLAPAKQDEVLAQLVPDSGRAGREMSVTGVAVDATRVRCPVLVLTGDDDRFIPRRIALRVARRYDAPLETFPGRGHMLTIEPGWHEVADRVARWLA